MGLEFESGGDRLACPDSGEAVAPGCPECGGEELGAALADDGPGLPGLRGCVRGAVSGQRPPTPAASAASPASVP